MKTYLSVLRNLVVTEVIKIHDYVQIVFENDIGINVYNDYEVYGIEDVKLLNGIRVVDIQDDKKFIKIDFEQNRSLIIDLNDKSYHGPEAMVLYIPGKPIIVWN